MDTLVTATVVARKPEDQVRAALSRALGWFGHVERVCSRFDPASEVFRLCAQTGFGVPVSPLLFEVVRFSLEVAAISGGAFDPTVGAALAQRGFDRNYLTGERIAPPMTPQTATFRDVGLNPANLTITLSKPLLIDLGGVAKGLAIDMAAKELARFDSFTIDAGGDMFVKGRNANGEPWRIGIEHPREDSQIIATVQPGQGAVCTSGDYERRLERTGEHHLLDPRTDRSPRHLASCTVIAPTALAADALSTAAFVVGPAAGLRLLQQQGVHGLLITPELAISTTPGFEQWLA